MKTVDTEYPCPDPVQSYVPGDNDVIAEADAVDPPHGFRELGVASRHIFGHGACYDIVAQTWKDADRISVTSGTYTLKGAWYVPVDEVFDTLEVLVYYQGNVTVAEFVKFVLVEEPEEVFVDGVDDGGAEVVSKVTWSTSKIEQQTGFATIWMYVKGDGAVANPISGVFVRRVAPTSIPDGTYYDGAYVPPDSVQTAEDDFLPMAADVIDDLVIGLTNGIQDNRRKLYGSWSHTATITDGGFAILAPYSGVDPLLHALSSSNQSGACLGGTTAEDQDYRTEFDMVADDRLEVEVKMDPLPFIAGIGQFYLTFGTANSVVTWTIEGV